MNIKSGYLSSAVMACFLGIFGPAQAAEVKPAPAVKTEAQAAKPATAAKPAASAAKSTAATKSVKSPSKSKSAKSSKSTKSAQKPKTVKTAEPVAAPLPVAAPAKAVAAPMPVQAANPYMSGMPANPYQPALRVNPYLAYQIDRPYQPASMADNPLAGMLAQSGLMASLKSKAVTTTGQGGTQMSKLSLGPLPVDIFMLPNQKPTVAFTTPCAQVEKATHGFPVFTAMTNFMYEMAGKINDSNALPMNIEPVCI